MKNVADGLRERMGGVEYRRGNCPVISKKRLADGVFDFTLSASEIADSAQAGQFAAVAAAGFTLRRPISIAGIDKGKGEIRLIIEVRGKGTKAISQLEAGDRADILAPLGRGFDLGYNTAVVVTGGIGAPPLLPVAEKYGRGCVVLSGFRNASAVILTDEFTSFGAKTVLYTDDGSAGIKGFAADALPSVLTAEKPDIVYACGPRPMLKTVAAHAVAHGVKCQLSLEERMGCCIGACLVCVCRANGGDGGYYARVCRDGPVFWGSEVVFDE
jgi:dihydroorotate dehydrogenase electron transfer subunit